MKIWAQGYRRASKHYNIVDIDLSDMRIHEEIPYEGLHKSTHTGDISANWVSLKPMGLRGDYAFSAAFTINDIKTLAKMLPTDDIINLAQEKLQNDDISKLFIQESGDTSLKSVIARLAKCIA